MNQPDLLQHYKVLKYLIQMGNTLYNNDCTEIKFRMRWDLLETETDTYSLFFTKTGAALNLIRIQKENKTGYTIAKFEIVHNHSYTQQNNMIYRAGSGFCFNGSSDKLRYTEPGSSNFVDLDCLPVESAGSLIVRDELEELEFQYGTVHNFVGDAFAMYCIFSLLNIVDNVLEAPEPTKCNRFSFLEVCKSEDIHELAEIMKNLSNKISTDLGV